MFTGDIYIRGKYATYLKYLSQKTEKNDHKEKVAGIFERMIDVYMTAAIVGLNFGLRKDDENTGSDTAKLFADVVNREQDNLISIFRIVMLVDNSTGLSADEKIKRAFKTPDAPENMKLFNAYVRGGVEWLYEQFTSGATTKEEYLALAESIRTIKGIEALSKLTEGKVHVGFRPNQNLAKQFSILNSFHKRSASRRKHRHANRVHRPY